MTNKRTNKKESKVEDAGLDYGELSEDGQKIVQAITAHLDLLREEFRMQMAEKDKEIAKLNEVVSTLKCNVMKLEERLEDADAYERRDTLIFSGDAIPEAKTGENCSAIIKEIVKTKLHINMGDSDISTAHRMGKRMNNQRPDKRSIIIKLRRRDQKAGILHACRQFKPDFYVNESLSPTRSTIMYALRKARKQFPRIISGCNSINGRVFVWLRPANAPLVVETHGSQSTAGRSWRSSSLARSRFRSVL